MGRLTNDGRGRLGGRAKGTPNKPKEPFGEWAGRILSHNRRYIENMLLSPDRDTVVPLLSALIVAASIDRLTGIFPAEEPEA